MKLTEIAVALDTSKSNVHKLLAILSRRGLVERLPDQTYRIGIKAWEIGSRAQPLELGQIAAPHLGQLVRDVSEGADIGLLDGKETVCIQLVECPQPVRVHARVGDRNPAHATSTGLVLLAALTDDEVISRLPKKLQKKAPGTFTDRDALLKELRRIRTRGYAHYRGGWRDDVTGVSMPLHGPDGRVAAGVCVPAPSYRVTRDWLDRIIPALRDTAHRIEHDLANAASPLGNEPVLRQAAGRWRR